ncbi:MAG: hypothetical protein EHM61_19420 [Acidobacteria bacterium]|nr:MAG: hypothetical protein EHM61_19420 [Acidobacteriota bacterium]
MLGGVQGFNYATAETNVGIGTTAPDRQLVVEGSQAIGKFRRYNSTGPGFGPAFLFERARGTNTAPLNMQPGDFLGKVQFRGGVSGTMLEYGALVFIGHDPCQNGRSSFVDRDLLTERMVISNTGNVGIGISAPTQRLDVAGNLRVRGTILYGAPATPVPDYVFEPDYRLMPLAELDQYVRTKRHLPNVAKASEIQDNGVNLGEFQMKLLEKIVGEGGQSFKIQFPEVEFEALPSHFPAGKARIVVNSLALLSSAGTFRDFFLDGLLNELV